MFSTIPPSRVPLQNLLTIASRIVNKFSTHVFVVSIFKFTCNHTPTKCKPSCKIGTNEGTSTLRGDKETLNLSMVKWSWVNKHESLQGSYSAIEKACSLTCRGHTSLTLLLLKWNLVSLGKRISTYTVGFKVGPSLLAIYVHFQLQSKDQDDNLQNLKPPFP